jgi:hypothetical protein
VHNPTVNLDSVEEQGMMAALLIALPWNVAAVGAAPGAD